ncbi:MAG: class I SAM-dependent DNA methyltransferase [Pirellulaceae bacterium]
MPLSWNEIRQRATAFAREWKDESREHAEAKSFWGEFFVVFGLRRRVVASFEEPVKTLKGTYSYIDLFWPNVVLAEHKSRGKSLGRAQSEAMEYVRELQNSGRETEVPRYLLLSDFARIALHDLEEGKTLEFPLEELPQHIYAFAFIPGYQQHTIRDQDPVNIKAVEILGDLHDALERGGYKGHALERFLVRVLFCLFADDTGIFERHSFAFYLENRTAEDGSDLGLHLANWFEVLNTPRDERQQNLDELLGELPYVNGDLFAEDLGFAHFNKSMRSVLIGCTRFDWSQISPAVFGSLFQAVMEPRQRRQIGGHYTSERDILKLVRSQFLDALHDELQRAKKSKPDLTRLHKRIAGLRFLDPACGCGNFLVIAYRELRLLELEILQLLYSNGQRVFDIHHVCQVDVDAMHGIEIQEWPVRIAEAALWLMDHQMNLRLSRVFGQYYVRLPLKKSPKIVQGNAIRLDWNSVNPAESCSYVLGNPPFVGAKHLSPEQRADMESLTADMQTGGLLDYVCAWYLKGAAYIQGTKCSVAFVSTSSIAQGEQVGVLWRELFSKYSVSILFGHRTFPWESEARGKAHVHVVIIGLGFNGGTRRLYDYDPASKGVIAHTVRNISPYLTEGSNLVVTNRSHPLCPVPEIGIGNKPIDDGNYLFSNVEKKEFLRREPAAKSLFHRWVGADEFINGESRWCLWLADCAPAQIRELKEVRKRIEAVKRFREASKSKPTRELAKTPRRFHVENRPTTNYLLIPRHTSETRRYIPLAYLTPKTLAGDSCLLMPGATLFHFGVMSSAMHMAWVRAVCGRLESRYRYSVKLVYNNFPWPSQLSDNARDAVEQAAKAVLTARKAFPKSSLADLYDPAAMPSALAKAHQSLDRAVDRCYRKTSFKSDDDRLAFLFQLFEILTIPLVAPSQ